MLRKSITEITTQNWVSIKHSMFHDETKISGIRTGFEGGELVRSQLVRRLLFSICKNGE